MNASGDNDEQVIFIKQIFVDIQQGIITRYMTTGQHRQYVRPSFIVGGILSTACF